MENQNNQPNTKSDVIQGELIQGADLLEIEKERIKTTLRAIEANEANDLRLYQYHMAKLEQDTKDKVAKLQIAKHLIYGGSAFIGIVVVLLVWMAFFGSESQATIASDIVRTGLTALGGVAIYLIGKLTFDKLTNNT